MAGLFTNSAANVFAPVTSGGQARSPDLGQMQIWGVEVETAINAAVASGARVYATKSALDADLAHPANTGAWVVADPTTANNGIYNKSGASGSGSWTKRRDLPVGSDSSALVAAEAAARIAGDDTLRALNNRLLASVANRPGDAPLGFISNPFANGDPANLTPIGSANASTTAAGAIVRIAGSGYVATRRLYPLEPARIYRARFVVKRHANSGDPANDGVRLAVAWFDQAKNYLGSVSAVQNITNLNTGSGRVEVAKTFASASGLGADIMAPSGAVYYRPYVQTFGNTPQTDIEVIESRDVSDLSLWSPDVSAFDSRIVALEGIDAGERLDDLESAVGTPSLLTYTYKSDAAAESVGGTVDEILLLNDAAIGDDGGGRFMRVDTEPSHADKFQTANGAWFEKQIDVTRLVSIGWQREIVILLTGQSNAIGAGVGGSGTIPTNVLAWKRLTSVWATPTLGSDPFLSTGANNFGIHGAGYIASATGRKVRLILVALGGLPIERWEADDADPSMWTRILAEVPAALAAAGLSYVDRVWWMQGDGAGTVSPFVYRDKLIKVKNQMKAQSWWREGHTYFLAGEYVQDPDNNAQTHALSLHMASEIDKDIGVVSSFGIGAKAGEAIHYSGEGLEKWGPRWGQVSMRPYAPVSEGIEARHCRSSVYFYLKKDGTGDFDDIRKACDFFSSLTFAPAARCVIDVGEGQWDIPAAGLRLAFTRPDAFEWTGVLASGFTKPVKANFTGTKATDLAMVRAKYLTEIRFVSQGLIPAGNSVGRWNQFLFTASAPTLQAACFRDTDPNLPKATGALVGDISQCCIFGWDGDQCRAIFLNSPSKISNNNVVIAHCTQGVVTLGNGYIAAGGTVFAHNSGFDAVSQYNSMINAFGATTTKTGGGSWSASTFGKIDARTADNIGSVTESSEGKVLVA